MNPSALQQALGSFGKGVMDLGYNTVGRATMGGLNLANNVVQNVAQDFKPPQTQTLPRGVQSPIPQNQIVPHQVAPSWIEAGINNITQHFSPYHSAPPVAPQQQGVMGAMAQRFATPQPTTPAPTAQPLLQPSPTPTTHWYTPEEAGAVPTPELNQLEQSTLDIFKKHGINPAVAYGIAQAEGGKIGNHNVWNINATDSNPNGAFDYGSHQQAAEGAAQLIRSMLDKQGVKGNDPVAQIKAIEASGYAGDPKTWQHRSASTGGAGKNGVKNWSDFVKSTNAWKKWADQQ